MKIKSQQDFWSGLIFVVVGVAFAWGSTNYSFGNSARPGAAYFPFGLGVLLALLGAMVLFKALTIETEGCAYLRLFDYVLLVRLKGGDPMIFGRALEELDALHAAGIEVEIVPGITSALAAAAELGVSLTQRGVSRNVVFVTPRVGESESASDWAQSVLAADTAVLYMASGQAAEIAAALMQRGLSGSTPAAIISNASLPNMQKVHTTLAQLPDVVHRVGAPALIVLGEVLSQQAQKNLPELIRQAFA